MKTVATIETGQPRPAIQNQNGFRVESCESETVRKVEESIAYMMRHLDEPLQVATLAARANVSPSHFFALFKRRVGCAPIDYFIRLRMRHACRLLDETVMSVKEVAATLGYDDPFYFSRIFKSVNQVAPSEYRLLKNGAKAAVKSCGITLRFFQPCESKPGLERNGSCLTPDGEGRRSRLGLNAVALSGSRNGIKC
jgi:transcriptional regulator GlxA family with amidase domain